MGLFSSKTKINVFSQAMPLADHDYNPIAEGIVGSLLTGADATKSILNTSMHHPMCNMAPMLNYAKDYYTLGLAGASQYTTAILDENDVAAAIDSDLGTTANGVVVDYNFVTNLTVDFAVLPFLINHRGYNSITNKISIMPSDLTLDTEYNNWPIIHVVTTDSVTLDPDLVTARIKYKIVSTYVSKNWDYTEYRYIYTNTVLPTTYHEETYTIASGLRIGREYCIAKYYELDGSLAPILANNWWFYDINSGKHPELDLSYDDEPDNYFYPVVPIRYNNVDYTAVAKQSTPLYLTSKKLLNKAGMDIQVIADLINDNPNVGDVDHAYVMWGIDLQTTRNESIQYLVEFFDYLADNATIEQNDFVNFSLNDEVIKETTFNFNGSALTAPSGTTTTTVVGYTDSSSNSYKVTTVNDTKAASLVEHGLDTAVTFTYIGSRIKKGSIGVKGAATMTKIASTANTRPNGIDAKKYIDDSKLILRLQLTTNTYKEVTVVGLVHTNRIYGGYSVETTLNDVIDSADEHNFIIPIHRQVVKRLPLNVRAAVHIQSVHMIINGVQFTKVKWYNTGIFKVVMILVAVVLYVVSYIVPALASYLIPAANAIITGVVVGTVLEVLNKIVPGLGTVLAVLYLIYQIYNFQWQNIGKGTITAAEYLELTACVIQLATVPIQYRIKDLNGDMEGLSAEHEARMAELEEIAEALDTSSFLNVTDILLLDRETLGSVFPVESPAEFYNRTTMNNAGLIVLDVVQNYHDALLQLPNTNQSIGGSIA